MRFTEIGQQLRAYRLESGLRAEEIAARLGVSRAALYRYEKGEVIKLDTINRLAELLQISPLSLLGIGVEYYHRPVGYFERLRQIEESAEQILQSGGPTAYLVTSDAYDTALSTVFEELAIAAAGQSMAEANQIRASADQVLGILSARKQVYRERRPAIISILWTSRVDSFLETGIAPGVALAERTRRACRQVARAEVLAVAAQMENQPMGLQFGLIEGSEPNGAFKILRARDHATLAINPFAPDTMPSAPDEAMAAHQRVAEAQWRDSLKGAAAAARLRELVAASSAGTP
jgi:transcriptional regulator with XRE-family HTH domain